MASDGRSRRSWLTNLNGCVLYWREATVCQSKPLTHVFLCFYLLSLFYSVLFPPSFTHSCVKSSDLCPATHTQTFVISCYTVVTFLVTNLIAHIHSFQINITVVCALNQPSAYKQFKDPTFGSILLFCSFLL